MLGNCILVLEEALTGSFVIPDWTSFGADIRALYDRTAANKEGAVADYIPQLARVDPEKFGVSVCSIDGQRLSIGDTRDTFTIQSSCKPINYCLALEELGESKVHEHVGCEPSGVGFNELTLNKHGRPHNPMINAGAIMCCSMIRPQLTIADRFDHVQCMWERLTGGVRPGFSNATFLSERTTADRNYALGYFMRENKAFPEGTDLAETLEFYFQCCSLELTADMVSVVAATLANGGVCPVTGDRVLDHATVQRCLSLMASCGMYDFSGEWAFSVGLPSKSSVSGVLMVVIPNVMGLCTWSPRLDEIGNSVRGIEFCRELVNTFNFHHYDNLQGGLHEKRDPRRRLHELERDLLVDLMWAASEGDVTGVARLLVQGADVDAADYDGRTALHLAASEGRDAVVRFLLDRHAAPSPVDRWGNTPLDDAKRAGHDVVAGHLTRATANAG